jgi:AraC-like DNA-binding protein
MNLTLRQKVAGSAAALALLAGAGGAYAITSGGDGNGREAFLNDVAKRLNVSPQELRTAFRGALADRLAADVKAGRITQAEADRIEKEAREHGAFPFPPPPGPAGPGHPPGIGPPPFGGPPGPGGPPHGPHGPFGAGLDAAAGYLGLTPAQLRNRLMSGKSLAQVATQQKKSVDGLKSAIEAAVKKELDQAVSGKRLTQTQEDQILSELRGHLDDLVNRRPGDRPPRPPWMHRRPHHW